MVTNQGLLVSVKMGLCKDQNDAVVPLFQPKEQPLQTNLIAMGGGPGGDMGDAQESPSAIGITVKCHSSGEEMGANGKGILPNKVSTTLIPKTEQAFPGHPQSSRPYPDNIQNLLKDKN
jgi:hypothetical protein